MKKTVLDYLENTCERFPEKIAFSDIKNSITFSELLNSAQRVGSSIADFAKPETIIPFFMDKRIETVIGFFGAVYAGCAYSLINVRYPAAKISSIINKLDSPIIITDSEHYKTLSEISEIKILLIDDLLKCNINTNLINYRRNSIFDCLPLYVNFTSGSTGNPKGVVVSHRNVVDFITEFVDTFSISNNDVIANQAPFDFDVSVKDIYSCIFTGARVEIIPTDYFVRPILLGDFLYERKITVMIWAVSALCFLTTMKIFDYKKPTNIRIIMFSGEVMPIKHLKRLQNSLPDVTYVNLYGPTEITCNCTYYVVDREFSDNDRMPIGRPFQNRKVFLLDEDNNEVTDSNCVGELCVSGSSVAIGYLKDPIKTNECFCQNPLNMLWNERIYRTGDLIIISENNEMEYFSRKDFQIKHLGHRIELTEIDGALQSIDCVERACCQYDNKKGKIIAFICGIIDTQHIDFELRKIIPDYMIPNYYIIVDEMPINKNGKIDRQKLMELYK